MYRKVMKTEQLSESEDEVFMKEDFYNHQPAAYRWESVVLHQLCTVCMLCCWWQNRRK